MPQIGHITSSSMSGSSVCGVAANAGARSRPGAPSRSPRARRPHADPPISGVTRSFEEVLVDDAAPDQRQVAGGVDEEVLGDPGRAEGVAAFVADRAQLRIGEVVLADELDGVVAVVLDVDPEDGDVGMRAGVRLEIGRLGPAGVAPGRPEVDQHPVTPVVGDRARRRRPRASAAPCRARDRRPRCWPRPCSAARRRAGRGRPGRRGRRSGRGRSLPEVRSARAPPARRP